MKSQLVMLSALVLLVLPAAFAATNSITITTNGTSFVAGQTLAVSGTVIANPSPPMMNVIVEYQTSGTWVVASLAHVAVSSGQFSYNYVIPNNGASAWKVQASYATGAPKLLGGLVLSNIVYFSVVA